MADRVSQLGIEVLTGGAGPARVSQLGIEVMQPAKTAFLREREWQGLDRVLAKVEFAHKDTGGSAATFPYSGHIIPEAAGAVLDRVLEFGPNERRKSSLFGDLALSGCRLRLSDLPDLVTGNSEFRAWLGRANQYALLQIEATVSIITESDWRLGKRWCVIFRGTLVRYTGESDAQFSVQLKDWFEAKLEEAFPVRTLEADFPTVPAANRALYGKIVLGSHSDETSALGSAPVATAEAATGVKQPVSDWLAGFGGSTGTAPSSLSTAEDVGAGAIDLGVFPSNEIYIQVVAINGGVPTDDPSPFVDDGEVVTIANNNAAITATCADAGDDAYRFFCGYKQSASGAVIWTQSIDTTDPVTGVAFTDMPAPGTDPTVANVTSGATPINTLDIWYAKRTAQMADGETDPSAEFTALITPYQRPRRITTDPVTGALWYWDYWRRAGEDFSIRVKVPATQLNGSGDVYGEYDFSGPGGLVEAVSGIPTPQGLVRCDVIGSFTDLQGASWVGLSVACHPCSSIDALYFLDANGDVVGEADGVVGPAYGVDITAPGQTGFSTFWGATPYRTGLTGQRHTVVYVRGPWGARLNGTQDAGDSIGACTLQANVVGVETIGDGATGTAITSGYQQLAWLLDNYLLPTTPHSQAGGGAWALATPTWADGTPRRHTGSFAAAELEASLEIPAGAARALVIDDVTDNRTVLKWCLQGLDAAIGPTFDGQYALHLLPPTRSSAGATTTIDHVNDILAGSFAFQDDERIWYNAIAFQYGYRHIDGAFRFAAVLEDTDAQTAYGGHRIESPSGTFDFRTVPSPSVAAQLADRVLQRHRKPPRLLSYRRGLSAVNEDLGARPPLTHPEGAAATGFVARATQVHSMSLSLGDLAFTIETWDRDWIGRDLTNFEWEEAMAERSFGGSRDDVCTTVSSRVVPPNRKPIRINWDEFPASVPLVAVVGLATATGTVTPYIANQTDLDTAVVTGTAHSTSTFTYQELLIPRESGTQYYELILTLGGGAADSDVNAQAWAEGRIGE